MNKVWAYPISRPLTDKEKEKLLLTGNAFVKSWTSHDRQLSASFDLIGECILLIQVDETTADASGCSIDKLTRFIKEIGQELNIDLMNRLLVAYDHNDQIAVVPAATVKELLSNGKMSGETLVYNTAVSNQEELKNWKQALRDTWLSKYLVKVG